MKTKMTSSHQPHQHINSTRESIPHAHNHHVTLSRRLSDTGTSITQVKNALYFIEISPFQNTAALLPETSVQVN